jgi:hypothetical protein
MADVSGRAPAPKQARIVVRTEEFRAWSRTLDPERRAKVKAAAELIVDGGPTMGRPHVDVIHGSRVRKLKEARVDKGTRLLFAFDSRGNAVMLLGGDKTGKWNRWYPKNIDRAERLYAGHERSIREEETRCLNRRAAGRPSTGMSR